MWNIGRPFLVFSMVPSGNVTGARFGVNRNPLSNAMSVAFWPTSASSRNWWRLIRQSVGVMMLIASSFMCCCLICVSCRFV